MRYCDRFLLMAEGTIHAQGGPEVVSEVAIREVFGMEARVVEIEGIPTVLPLRAIPSNPR